MGAYTNGPHAVWGDDETQRIDLERQFHVRRQAQPIGQFAHFALRLFGSLGLSVLDSG